MNAFNFLRNKNVTRLCHFTKLKDLVHILSSEDGILASNQIDSDIKDQKDTNRYDGEPDYVCCSIEYPNSWYLRTAKKRDDDNVFKDWGVIYIDLSILQNSCAKFCPCNAAKDHGTHIFSDINKLNELFAPQVSGYSRSSNMCSCCPTNDQAEVLIKGNIPRQFLTGIAVIDKDNARTVYSILEVLKVGVLPIYCAPDVLNTNWSKLVRIGKRPKEELFSAKER